MANRRMFAKPIIESDLFLDMSLSAQALYFHLSMRADDDGFVNSPKRIQRMIGASEDDFKILIAKSFLIPFESGIVVIKHWRIHNFIRNDRYKETIYKEEKSSLVSENDKAYELKSNNPNGIPMVYQRDTQDSSYVIDNLDVIDNLKDNIDLINKQGFKKEPSKKNQLVKKRESGKNKETIDKIVELYNQICLSLPKAKILTKARKKKIKARLKTYSIEDFETAFRKTEASSFLRGENDRGWTANLNWLIDRDDNMAKVLEDSYIDREHKSKAAREQEEAFKMAAEWAEEDD